MSGGWWKPRRRPSRVEADGTADGAPADGVLGEGISYSVRRRDGADGVPVIAINVKMTPEAKARLTFDGVREDKGEGHPDTLTAGYELAEVLWGQGSVEDAVELLRYVVAGRRAVIDPNTSSPSFSARELTWM